jgi:hypothetical protein
MAELRQKNNKAPKPQEALGKNTSPLVCVFHFVYARQFITQTTETYKYYFFWIFLLGYCCWSSWLRPYGICLAMLRLWMKLTPRIVSFLD